MWDEEPVEMARGEIKYIEGDSLEMFRVTDAPRIGTAIGAEGLRFVVEYELEMAKQVHQHLGTLIAELESEASGG